MNYVTQKHDRLSTSSKSESKEKSLALSAMGKSSGGNGKQKYERKPKGACWNCGGKGHKQDQCPSPPQDGSEKPSIGGGKTSSGNSKGKAPEKGNSANATQPRDKDGAWVVCPANGYDSDGDSIPDLLDVESDPEDWFSEVNEDEAADWEYTVSVSADDEALDTVALAVIEPVESEDTVELYDSGSTHHLSPYRNHFVLFRTTPPRSFDTANQQSFSATGVGDMLVEVPNGADMSTIHLTKVLYAPEIGYTLISIGYIDDAGCTVTFGGGCCTITTGSGTVIRKILKSPKGLYRIEHAAETGSTNAAERKLNILELHRCMGHIGANAAKQLVTKGFVTGIQLVPLDSDENPICDSCVAAKAKCHPVPKEREGTHSTECGGKIHSDLWGPAPVKSLGGWHYYVSFMDDKTRETKLYLLCAKSETFKTYKKFEAWAAKQRNTPIKCLQTDRGGEFMSDEFTGYLESQGTMRKLTVHDTPQQNGVAERLNGVLVTKVCAMLHNAKLPQ